MIRRRAVIGLSLLSALLVCAFAAQSASALKPPTSANTTAFTCVKGAGKDFKDAHCDEAVPQTGEFGHVAIANDTTTEIDLTNSAVTESTKKSEPAIFTATIALSKIEIECLKVKSIVKTSTVHNVEPVSKQHTFTGTIETEFSECNVKKLTKCVVSEPLIFKFNVHGVEGMEGPKGEKNAMGIEFVGDGPEELIGSITLTNKGAEACSLHNKTFPISGSMIATNGPTTESKQDNKHSGSTLVFTPKFKMQTLRLGPNSAEFHGILTPTMAGGGNPIAMTTTT